jgi:quercetin dioxygenase-like cupin family protein
MDMTDRRAFLSMASMAAMAQAAAAETALSPGTQSKEIRRPLHGMGGTFVEVNFPIGVRLVAHKHPGFVLGYVTEGEFRFGLNDETPSVLASGQAFYEPPGANHTAGDSANSQRAVRILAIIIAPLEKI